MQELISSAEESVERVFSESGILSRFIQNYEVRDQQRLMSLDVLKAYKKNQVLLVEAATGVGKSLAYLVPAILFACIKKEVTVIATNTIALQEQLLKKDIPFLLDALGVDLQVTLAKGMTNYLCLKKWDELVLEKGILPLNEQQEIEKLERYLQIAEEGCSAEIRTPLAPGTWEKVAAERVSCIHVECPHFKKCFFFKARKKLHEANLLIVNHHLLIADVAARLRPDFQEDKSPLPKFSRLILDEAHHLEEIALESFSARTDRLELVRLLGRIYSDNQPLKSRIGMIKIVFSSIKKKISSEIQLLLDVEIPAQKRVVVLEIDALFYAIEEFCEQKIPVEKSSEYKRWRIIVEMTKEPLWLEEVESLSVKLQEEWQKLSLLLVSLRKQIIDSCSDGEKERISPELSMLEMVEGLIEQKVFSLEQFIMAPSNEHRVRWVETPIQSVMKNLTLVDARLNVAENLQKHLFSLKDTAILCSATLAINQDFSLLKQQIGLNSEVFIQRTVEKIYNSPFDYQKNALFLVPKDFPYPHEPLFLEETVAAIRSIIQVSQGGCFLLFTSYEMLQKCYEKIALAADKLPFFYLKQGGLSKSLLLERFRERKNAVLFATSSFWEGIDIAGEALRCVVLTKLPFKVPTEPLFQAMGESLAKEGKDSFHSYSLPLACLKFKQGFGRLIRTSQDRGCVVCLDKRVMTKSYGKVFQKSLPTGCPILFQPQKQMLEEMRVFYEIK